MYISELPQKLLSGEQRAVHSSCLCPPTLWWQQNYSTLWENFEMKNFSFLFFTSLLLPLQFHLSYKLCTVCPLEIVWFLSFMLSKVFFSFCTASGDFVWYVTLSAIYGALIYCLTLSNLANLFMYFVLLTTTFPPQASLTWCWKSFLKKTHLMYRLQYFFRREKPTQPNGSFLHNFSPFTISKSIRTLLHSGATIYFPEF